jgi:hypothetical protein
VILREPAGLDWNNYDFISFVNCEESFFTRKSILPAISQVEKDEETVFPGLKRDYFFNVKSVNTVDQRYKEEGEPIVEKTTISKPKDNKRMKPYSAVRFLKRMKQFSFVFSPANFSSPNYHEYLPNQRFSKTESIVTFNPQKQKGFIIIQSAKSFIQNIPKQGLSGYLAPVHLPLDHDNIEL